MPTTRILILSLMLVATGTAHAAPEAGRSPDATEFQESAGASRGGKAMDAVAEVEAADELEMVPVQYPSGPRRKPVPKRVYEPIAADDWYSGE
jgi:hypothetical protein